MGFFKRDDNEQGIESIAGARIVPAPGVEDDDVEFEFERLPYTGDDEDDEDEDGPYIEDIEYANEIAVATPAQLAGEATVWLAIAANDENGDAAGIASAFLAMARYVQDFGNIAQKQQEQ